RCCRAGSLAGGGFVLCATSLGRGLVGGIASLSFHRLAEAVTFAIHLEDVTTVCQSVQERGRHLFAVGDLPPFSGGQIAGDEQALTFVGVGEDLKEQFGAAAAERQIAEFVADEQIDAVELTEQAIEAVLLMGLFQLIDQTGGSEEANASPEAAGGEA